MSFRRRLTSFFVVIVLLPMLAIAVIVFRLISDSQQARSSSRANGVLAAVTSVYRSDQTVARATATRLAIEFARERDSAIRSRTRTLVASRRLERIVIARNRLLLAAVGRRDAVAPGVAQATSGGSTTEVLVSTTTAGGFARMVGRGNGIVIRRGTAILAAEPAAARRVRIPISGSVTLGHELYTSATAELGGVGGTVVLTVLSPARAVAAAGLDSSRALAAGFLVGFLALTFAFAWLASRGLESQIGRFLAAARRLAGGDFSAPVPVEGRDEFALLAAEFNGMSEQLAERLRQLQAERRRLRESIRRAGQAFASNLDRDALLELALKTAVDAADGQFGRLSARCNGGDRLDEMARAGSLEGSERAMIAAERSALGGRGGGEASEGDVFVVCVRLGPIESSRRAHGLITVGRRGRRFSPDDVELLRSLAAQTTLALENVELHEDARRQAVTDKLTGLANHGRFQEVLAGEMEQVRRYGYPVGLIMLDIDDFKQVNDSFGHRQGDLVLQQVAQVLRETSREADAAARYGGEELALILPHTDLDGSYAIAERVRTGIESLSVPRLDGGGTLYVTASVGVGATTEGDAETLISATDAALYEAKRSGKNRTIRASAVATNATGGE